MKFGSYLALCLNLIIKIANAQLTEGDTVHWRFISNMSAKMNRGNVERFIATPEAEFMHLSKKRSFGFSLRERYTYGTFGKTTTERDLLSRNIAYIFPDHVIYPYIIVWLQTHELQRLKFRYQFGPGATVSLVSRKKWVAKLSLTGTYEKNIYSRGQLSLFDDDVKRYDVFRGTGRILGSHVFVANSVFFNYEGFFQQALDNQKNWRVFFETSLTVRIKGDFSMRPALTYEYQTVYVHGRKPSDLIFNFSLSYRKQGTR